MTTSTPTGQRRPPTPRNVVRTLLTLTFLGLIPVGCCKQVTREYVRPQELLLVLAEPAPDSPALASGARTSAPELLASVRFRYEYVAAVSAGSPFVGAAYALQCPAEGMSGMKDKIAAVAVTSTGLFNGVAAGQSLQHLVRCRTGPGRAEFPLAQLADSLSARKLDQLYETVTLRIGPRPADNAAQQFRVSVRLGNGQEVAQLTPAIVWN